MEHREDITQFTAVDQQADPRFFITFLDAGNALEDIKSVKRVMLAQLELLDGMRPKPRHDLRYTRVHFSRPYPVRTNSNSTNCCVEKDLCACRRRVGGRYNAGSE